MMRSRMRGGATGPARRWAAIAAVLSGLAMGQPAHAQWAVRELPTQDGTAVGSVATATAQSGDAEVQIGCSPEGLPFVSVEYIGYDSEADALNVRYRVDARNTIVARWPREPSYNSLLAYNANPVFVEEFTQRVARGTVLRVSVEVLPDLVFDLRGSSAAINRMRLWCASGSPMDPQPADAADDGADPAAEDDG